MLLKGALQAKGMVGLKMNVQRKNLDKILKTVTALRNPTISPLLTQRSGEQEIGPFDQWVALETIIDEGTVRKIIPALKEAGAEGIIEYSLNKLIY